MRVVILLAFKKAAPETEMVGRELFFKAETFHSQARSRRTETPNPSALQTLNPIFFCSSRASSLEVLSDLKSRRGLAGKG